MWESCYEQADGSYAGIEFHCSYRNYPIAEVIALIERNTPQGGYVLEVGAGSSDVLATLRRKGYQTAGLDISLKGCFLAREKGVPHIICGNLFEMPVAEKKFDTVYSMGLVEHFPEPERVLMSIRRVLKEQGKLITVVPNVHNSFYEPLMKVLDREIYRNHYPCGIRELKEAYRRAGLVAESAGYMGTLNIALLTLPAFRRGRFVKSVLTQAIRANKILWFFFSKGIKPPETAFFSPFIYCTGTLKTEG